MVYLKLGPGATIFYDPSTQVLIRGGEIIAVDRLPKSKKFGLAHRSGHVMSAPSSEYEAYCKANKIEPKVVSTKKRENKEPVDDYPYNPELLAMSAEELMAMIKNEGFLEEDMAKFNGLTDPKKIIKLYDEINKEYT